MSDGPGVTIAGGGLSGLTAALRLAERGYQVTLYEQKSWPGGNLGSRRRPDGEYLDVYPHMYLEWYRNFWALLEGATKQRKEERFEAFSTVKQLPKGKFPRFASLKNMYSPWWLLPNLLSGVGRPSDMFVFGYANFDLLAETFNPTINLDNVDVNAFVNTRPYMTRAASDAFDSFITRVWAIPSYLASAPDYRTYLRYSILNPLPAYWLPTGSGFKQVIEPLVAAVRAAGVDMVTNTELTGVTCTGGRVTEIGLRRTRPDAKTGTWVGIRRSERTEAVENLLLAVPAAALSLLVRTPVAAGQESVVQAAPDIAGIVRLRAAQVPLIYLYFKRKLPQIPREPVGLFGSSLSLAFTDISQTWRDVPAFKGRTVLAVSSSDTGSLPGTTSDADAQAMLLELSEYLPFEPGKQWGESPDIDWDRTVYETNVDSQLFINQTGTDAWRPNPSSDHLANLYMAGDFCNNDVGMTTIESAVTTGLQAAKVIVERNRHGEPVTIIPPDHNVLYDLWYVWARYAMGPSAYALGMWSRVTTWLCDGAQKTGRKGLPWLAANAGRSPGLTWLKAPRPGGGGAQRRDS
ncbi:MAG: FAD-dependent oxidoreductase [Solirubrobacteraceae bacterium]